MATETVQNPPAPVESAIRNLRVCRGYMLGCCSALDQAGLSEAVHYLRTSLTSLDDCLDRLEKPELSGRMIFTSPVNGESRQVTVLYATPPANSDYDYMVEDETGYRFPVLAAWLASEQPTSHMDDVFVRRDTIADDRRDDLMMDADRSESL
jgi:hypothetical protein